ncbi:hypothetical protein EJ05DRAFT_497238 [Pseudovirgaria hyperparasitica]|uniref:Spindle pole body component n=1 Tax=Pseudovirgaria hyperparasitica TaxID=470096 RepID=A0A6A6WHW5_9PEZI|nr:uncharacterized protein EJ05DRAFT_497238 [Pseudovirgaria hyperparasitica]KAF2762388.1 hypothetical protein EJ05DRAFT_497238 [Pseudovirgaria hyperparasitica]
MELQDDSGDPFDVAAIWQTSIFAKDMHIEPSDLFPGTGLDIPAVKLDNPYAPKVSLDEALQLPNIDDFQFASLDDSLQPLETETSSDEDQLPVLHDEIDDLWDLECEFHKSDSTPQLFSWEAFESQTIDRPSPLYLSEAGPTVFDAILSQTNASTQKDTRAIRTDALLNCLFNLGLGRSSVLFQFTKGKNVAHSVSAEHMTGLSVQLTQAVIGDFLECGTTFRLLTSFVDRTYASAKAFPAMVALANTVSTVLSTMVTQLESRYVQSLLQLEALFKEPKLLMQELKDLLSYVRGARTNTALVVRVYNFVAKKGQQSALLNAVNLHVLARVSQPWLNLVQEWTGMHEQTMYGGLETEDDFFAQRAPDPEDKAVTAKVAEFLYIHQHMPPFIPDAEGEMIFETGSAVRFLRHHHPEHPTCSMKRLKLQVPELQWRFTWDDVERTAGKAKDFEASLQNAIKRYVTGDLSRPASKGQKSFVSSSDSGQATFIDFANFIENSASLLDSQPPPEESQLPQELVALMSLALDGTSAIPPRDVNTFEPPLALSPVLTLIPLLRIQAQLVNAVTLRLFFRTHGLRHHLDLHRQYHLFGDGVFLAQLSTALFSPDLRTAEREKGKVRTGATMGLRLGTRTTWPPASSELRLALMGVLSDCYHSSELYLSHVKHTMDVRERKREDGDLPGRLSFSVRHLPEAEITRVMDPNSLYALDFLRLQYDAPSPINLVITPSSLEKYDQVFKFLCRLLRMLFVVNHLPRDLSSKVARKFRTEAIHFVVTVSSYFFDTGICEKWTSFAESLDNIEIRLRQEDATHEYGSVVSEGLGHVRKAHEACLDRIMLTLFLRKRHDKVIGLLEEIFSYILEFAGHAEPHVPEVDGLYKKLHDKTKVFLQVCRGLSGRRSKKVTTTTGDEMDVEKLVVKMDVSGYYGDESP